MYLFCSKLDAFIYDGTVLNYLASKDDECRLLQVGSWSRMTGYALAFPRNSKFKNMFDAKILELRENGKIGVYIHIEEIQMSLGTFESIGRISFSKIA